MNILVSFGSRSTEHDVSIISGLTVFETLEKTGKYTVTPLYITRDGVWQIGGNLSDIEAYRKGEAKGKEVSLVFSKDNKLHLKENSLFGKTHVFDLVVPIMHGMNGEDGTLQGLLEMANVPYTGSGVLGSAMGMDKVAMKDILKSHNIPLVNYVFFYRDEFQLQPKQTAKKVVDTLGFPVFVKPANLGSSIGISRVDKVEDLENAIEVAAYYDSRIICEAGVSELQEINCAIVGDSTQSSASLLEEPVTFKDFLTFEEKYINSGGTMQGVKSKVQIPATLPEKSMTEKIQKCAQEVFKILHCSGVARVDFLVDTKKKSFYVNEINTIPGSLQKHLWEKSDMPFNQLLEKMIEQALKRQREKEKSSFAFSSDILNAGEMKK